MDQRANEFTKQMKCRKLQQKKIEFDVDSLLESMWKIIFYSDFISISINCFLNIFLHVFLLDVDFYDCVLHLLPLTDFELDKMGHIKRARQKPSQTCFEKTENQSLS